MAAYDVTYERDDGGWWIVRVHGVEGVHSDGRTIADARRRAREALALAIGDGAAEAADFKEKVELPAEIDARLREYRKVGSQAEAAQTKALEQSRELAQRLRKELGLSERDIGELFELSHQ